MNRAAKTLVARINSEEGRVKVLQVLLEITPSMDLLTVAGDPNAVFVRAKRGERLQQPPRSERLAIEAVCVSREATSLV